MPHYIQVNNNLIYQTFKLKRKCIYFVIIQIENKVLGHVSSEITTKGFEIVGNCQT